jgi:hypothetical protein
MVSRIQSTVNSSFVLTSFRFQGSEISVSGGYAPLFLSSSSNGCLRGLTLK